ncbi:MAG: hypothetical protein ACTS3F_03435 [Phycisphaerales bacterium]
MTQRSPLAIFLPGVKPGDGPFALLGVETDRCDAASIDAALRRRLAAIDAHPQRNTPEADELRAALHSAAAHLHHPAIRAAAQHRFNAPAPTRATSAPPTQAPATPHLQARPPAPAPSTPVMPQGPFRLPPEEEAYRDLVVRVLVHAGGWNETAKRRLAAITAQHNRPIRHLQAALRLIAINGPARRYRPTLHSPHPDPATPGATRHANTKSLDPSRTPVAAAPARRHQRRILLVASILLTLNSIILLLVFAGIIRSRLSFRDAASARNTPEAIAARGDDPSTISGAEARRLIDRASREPIDDSPIAHLNAIRTAAADLPENTTRSMATFNRRYTAVAGMWRQLSEPERQALITSISDFVAAAGILDPAEAMRAIDTVASPSDPISRLSATPRAEQLPPAAFSIAMLSRLQRDRDLPPTVQSALARRIEPVEALAGLIPGAERRGPSFDDGLALALRALAARITPRDGEDNAGEFIPLWRAWLDITRDTARQNRSGGALVALDTLELILTDTQSLQAEPASLEIAKLLTASIDWLDPMASRRLLRWLDTERIPRAQTNIVLSWLAATMPDRIGSDLIVAPNALPAQRTESRDRLAIALGVTVAPATEFDSQLIARAQRLIAEAESISAGADHTEALTLAAALASLNEAAAHRWTQQRAAAEAALARADTQAIRESLASSLPPPEPHDLAALTAPATGDDARWALRVLQSESDRDTLAGLLNQLTNLPRDLGPADAGVLVEVGMTNTSTPIRDAAQRALVRYAQSPALIEALLQHSALGRRGLDRLLLDVVKALTGGQLPHWSDPRFAIEARRALLESQINIITQRRLPAVEGLAATIARAYTELERATRISAGLRAGTRPTGTAPNLPNPGDSLQPANAAAALADTMQTIASLSPDPPNPISSLGGIATRRRARQALANAAIQHFHAEQTSAAEYLAHIVHAEQPDLRLDVLQILDTMRARRDQADSITTQIVAAESAMAALWIMRLGYHDASTQPTAPGPMGPDAPQPAPEPGSDTQTPTDPNQPISTTPTTPMMRP